MRTGAIVICVVFATGVVGVRGTSLYGDSGDIQTRVDEEATSTYLAATPAEFVETPSGAVFDRQASTS